MSNSRAIRRPAWGRTCGRLGGLLLVLLIAIVPASTALAQESGLVAGQAATGTITDANYMNVWRYESPGNETINVAVEATSGNLDTTLVVISSSLDVLAVNDDIDPSNGNFNSAISGLVIPNADTIFVIVSRYDTQAGSSTGAYRVLLTTGSGGGMITTGGTTGGSTTGGQTGTLTLDQAVIDGKLQDAFDHLIALGVIPDWSGTIGINIPDNAFLESFRADEHQLFMRVGQGYRAADVIIRTDFIWNGDDDVVACGVAFRTQGNGNAYTVYVGREGWAELGRWENSGDDWVSLGVWDVTGLNTRNGGKNNLVITAVDDQFHVFVNYELIATATDRTITGNGEFYLALYKEDAAHLRCDYPGFWVITQDQ